MYQVLHTYQQIYGLYQADPMICLAFLFIALALEGVRQLVANKKKWRMKCRFNFNVSFNYDSERQ